MARLALTILGGILGAFLIPGVGASLGFSIGSAIGGIIGQLAFPGKGTHVYGPRVNDLQVSSSAPGQVIPLLFGAMRLGGQIIWSTGLIEKTTNKTISAKGGPSVTQTTYTYSVSFAAAFCQGEATITRLWGDSKLIYNKIGNVNPNRGAWNSVTLYNVNDLVTWTDKNTYICMVQNTNELPSNSSFWAQDVSAGDIAVSKYQSPTLYTGSETQLPDSLIVSHQGATSTPAYRGTCYAVWEDFPLADFGNRLPNIRAEVTSNPTASYPEFSILFEGIPTDEIAYQPVITYDNQTMFVMGKNGLFCNRIDLVTNKITATGSFDPTPVYGAYNPASDVAVFGPTTRRFVSDGNGDLWAPALLGSTVYMVCYDGWTFKGKKKCQMETFAGSLISYPLGVNIDVSGQYIMAYHQFNYVHTIRVSDAIVVGAFVIPAMTAPAVLNVNSTIPIVDSNNNIYIVTRNGFAGAYDWYIWKAITTAGVTIFDPQIGVAYTDVETHSYLGDATVGQGMSGIFDAQTNSLIVFTNAGTIYRIDCSTMQIVDQIGTASAPAFYTGSTQFQLWDPSSTNVAEGIIPSGKARAHAGYFYTPAPFPGSDGTHTLYAFTTSPLANVGTLEMRNFAAPPSGVAIQQEGYVIDAFANALIVTTGQTDPLPSSNYYVYRLFLDRINAAGETADDVVTAICELAGIAAGDIDASLLAGITVKGYPVSSLTAAKDMINTLGQAYFFEGRETDFKLQFIPRGQAAALTIDETDLGLLADNAALVETIGQEQDVPKSVEIVYIDPNVDYQQGQQKRIRHSKTKKSNNQTSISMPLVLNSYEAAQMADKIMWTSENERRTYKTNLWKALYMLLDPCDVINFNYHGLQLTARVSGGTVGQNFAIALELTNEDTNTYTSAATGNNSTGFVGQTLTGLSQTLLWILDIPYLQDQDADASGTIGYYAGMDPASSAAWAAGVLYSSSDATTWNQIDASTTKLAYGIAQTVLGDISSPWSWDETNSLTLLMVQGDSPTSDTYLNVLNGTNAAILYPSLEVIQFRTVAQNLDGTITLSGLLRGRRGTEWARHAHAVGEVVFFPLISGGLLHEQVSSSVLNLLRFYKAITVGMDLNSVTANQQISLIGRDQMPYAPAQFTGTQDGSSNITMTWSRRTRLGGEWRDLTGSVPLNEATESYDVEILNQSLLPTIVVVRTFSGLTTPTCPYTAAQQTTDFGHTLSDCAAIVYQNSAVVGRGFGTENDSILKGIAVSGGSDATSIQGVPVSTTPPTDGQVLTYVAADGEAEWKTPSTPTVHALTQDINQTAHGFAVADVIYFTGSAWAKAKSNDNTKLGVGIVTAVADADNFTITVAGFVTGLSGLTAGQYYFVSDATAGLLTSTEPTSTNSYSNPILLAQTTTTGLVLPWRASAIQTSSQQTVTAVKTANYTANAGEVVLCNSSGAGFTVQLPGSAAAGAGTEVTVKKVTTDANTMTVSRTGSDTIETATSVTFNGPLASVTFVSDGAGGWWVK